MGGFQGGQLTQIYYITFILISLGSDLVLMDLAYLVLA